GSGIAAVLSGAGVGRVDVLEGGCVEPWDVSPGGLPPESVGERRDKAAQRLVRRCAPSRPRRRRTGRASPADSGEERRGGEGVEPGLSLVVVAPRDGLAAFAPDPAVVEPLVAAGVPHLFAGVIEGTGVVGPLVLPGVSGCAGCLDLGRAERDAGWLRMLAQWRSGRASRAVPSCDLALATAVAGLAAGHALAFLDGAFPAAVGTRWEAPLPGLDWRSERVRPHP
ncbi:ThiF family adenylyltransferase, partial [Streptomyces sp. T-3]|nr:ThiF family adenylyltransferase [Streptomyces sp. T-3]